MFPFQWSLWFNPWFYNILIVAVHICQSVQWYSHHAQFIVQTNNHFCSNSKGQLFWTKNWSFYVIGFFEYQEIRAMLQKMTIPVWDLLVTLLLAWTASMCAINCTLFHLESGESKGVFSSARQFKVFIFFCCSEGRSSAGIFQ